MGAVLTVAGFRMLKQQEATNVRFEINREVDTYTKFLHDAFRSTEAELASVAGLFTSTGGVTASEFRTFVRPILQRNAGT